MSTEIQSQSSDDFGLEELRFQATFNHAAVGIAHVGLDGAMLRVNQAFCEIVGYGHEELLKLQFQDFTYPDDLAADLNATEALKRGEINTFTMEKRYIRKDGRLVWAELIVSCLYENGQPLYFISVIKDIDRRKKAEEALESSRHHLERRIEQRTVALILEMRERELVQMERDGFFDLAMDPMVMTDRKGYFHRVNPAFCRLLGYSSDELLSRPLLEFIHPEDRDRSVAYRMRVWEDDVGELGPLENRYLTKDGQIKWLSWNGRTIVDRGLNYVTGRDITERKAEELLTEQKHVVMTTNSKLNAIGLMAANMAHEINNPLTIIYGEGCLMRKMTEAPEMDRSKLKRMAENVVRMSERIVSIVTGLRALARDGSSDPMRCVPLRQIFDDTIPFCRGKIASKNVTLKVDLPVEEVFVCCRSVQLSQALLNLLNNAYDAAVENSADGLIRVFTRETRERVEICVSDSGRGLDPEVHKSLFQPFITSKPAGQGLGLGLSISRTMIEANGGELFLDDNMSETTFVISLPRVSND